jgi:hypothetical protein
VKKEKTMVARIIFGVSLMLSLVIFGYAGGKEKTVVTGDFGPGDTLRYTVDGSIPDRTSRFVLFNANTIVVKKTTVLKARLYRAGYLPSTVQTRTVFVRDSLLPPTAQMMK